jgi:CDP-diacylglycerol---serine O-phosphatidyltransferase
MLKNRFKDFINRNRWFKYIPNTLTLCNSLCGFGAILYTLNAYLEYKETGMLNVYAVSAWIILCAMIFDALDGFAARIFNAASMHGLQMDSLADMVTFGVAPAVMVAIMAHCLKEMRQSQYLIVWVLCAVYMGCAALRLATYNVHAMLEKKSGDKFSGLPSPGAAAGICSTVIFYSTIYKGNLQPLAWLLPVYAAILGLLMVSNITYPHVGRWLQSVRRNPRSLLLLLTFLVLVTIFRVTAIAVVVNLYIFSGPIIAVFKKLEPRVSNN